MTPIHRSSKSSAYIFQRTGTQWKYQVKLAGSNNSATSFFGGSIGLVGEYAIVGAHLKAGTGGSGASYIFNRK